MRILHTGDFHAGKVLRGLDRTPEIAKTLTHIADIAKSEKVDAVLVAGDVFDTVNPSALAEECIYNFYLLLREYGIPSVTIAGNHDSAKRLESVKGLLSKVGAHLVTELTPNTDDLFKSIIAKDGTELQVCAFPFVSERRLLKVSDITERTVGEWRTRYQEGMSYFLRKVAAGFRPNALHMLMMHATIDGAKPSGSERDYTFDITNTYTVSQQMFPQVQYVALGHIHKPQQVSEMPPAYYSGSVIQLDFGEAGEKKYINVIDAQPGRPAQVQTIPLPNTVLKNIYCTLDDLDSKLMAHSEFEGYLKVNIHMAGESAVGLKERIVQVLPKVLAIEIKREEGTSPTRASKEGLSDVEKFELYHQKQYGTPLPADIRTAFEQLLQEVNQ